jgi:hypothetical protein
MSNKIISIPELPDSDKKRFWSKVDKKPGQGPKGDCWECRSRIKKSRYGTFSYKDISYSAHRVAYFLTHGPIPDDLCVLHDCDNPPCCNPDHLWVGTHKDNAIDKVMKDRCNTPTGDRHGSRTHPECRPRGKKHGAHTKPERRARGSQHGNSKLTENSVSEIKRRLRSGDAPRAIALDFGVHIETVGYISRGKTWTHVI